MQGFGGKHTRRGTDMLDAVIRHAAHSNLPLVDCILDSSPALQTCAFASVRRVQQEQVNVAESAFLD